MLPLTEHWVTLLSLLTVDTNSAMNPLGFQVFALEFHIQFYVWREDGPQHRDSRKKQNGETLRKSRQLQHLGIEGDESSQVYIYEAQVSCLVTGLDQESWVAYLFLDTYYQGTASSESVTYYHRKGEDGGQLYKPDPLTAGTCNAQKPIWTPREYFLIVYECRLKQVRHALHNLASRLLLKLEPYIRDSTNLEPAPVDASSSSLAQKKKTQQMLNEASRVLRQTIHSICKAIEVWDRFSSRDAAYLSDILRVAQKSSKTFAQALLERYVETGPGSG
ncbi:hypothetical protein ACJ41O_006165 [Fusarium nematophilum]